MDDGTVRKELLTGFSPLVPRRTLMRTHASRDFKNHAYGSHKSFLYIFIIKCMFIFTTKNETKKTFKPCLTVRIIFS